MTAGKKRVLKLFALVYAGLVVAFFVFTAMTTKGPGKRRTLDEKLARANAHLTEPLDLTSLEGKPVTAPVADALTSAGITVIATADDAEAAVGPGLVARGAVFSKAVLPAGTKLTQALWNEVLDAERQSRLDGGRDDYVYVTGTGDIMGFDYTLIFVVVNFLGLLVILYLLLWEPILKVLDDRAATIADDLATASKTREDAAGLKGKYQQLMIGSKQERQELIAEGRKEGQAERQRIVGTAREESDKIIARTQEELQAAADRARSDLRGEIGGLSISLAEKILAREVTEKDNQQLIEDFLAKLNDLESSN